jgi:hypothetical protein
LKESSGPDCAGFGVLQGKVAQVMIVIRDAAIRDLEGQVREREETRP